jgi:hypothetical protein
MGEKFLPASALTAVSLFELVEEDRIQASQDWFTENMQLLEDSIQRLKAEYQAQAESAYDDKRREILDRLSRQFTELSRQSPREVEAYLAAQPQKMAKFALLQEHQSRQPKKRGARAAVPAPNPCHSAEEDLGAILSEMREAGVDINELVIFADGCFLYRGGVFCVGDRIQVETRNPGRLIQAAISAVTVAELELAFKDNTIVTLTKEQLTSRDVVLVPAT